MTDKQKLLACLIHIRENGPWHSDEGICYNADEIWYANPDWNTSYVYHLVPDIAVGWPKHSQESDYPIPATNKEHRCAEDSYYNDMEKWEGEQGKLRYELLNYMIEKLEAEIL